MSGYLRPPTGGVVCHVLNRANARLPLLACPADHELFEQTLQQAHQRVDTQTARTRLLGWQAPHRERLASGNMPPARKTVWPTKSFRK